MEKCCFYKRGAATVGRAVRTVSQQNTRGQLLSRCCKTQCLISNSCTPRALWEASLQACHASLQHQEPGGCPSAGCPLRVREPLALRSWHFQTLLMIKWCHQKMHSDMRMYICIYLLCFLMWIFSAYSSTHIIAFYSLFSWAWPGLLCWKQWESWSPTLRACMGARADALFWKNKSTATPISSHLQAAFPTACFSTRPNQDVHAHEAEDLSTEHFPTQHKANAGNPAALPFSTPAEMVSSILPATAIHDVRDADGSTKKSAEPPIMAFARLASLFFMLYDLESVV